MRFLKLATISVLSIFLVLWLISLLIPSQVLISRAIDIPASPQRLWPQLSDLRAWPNWNVMLDSAIRNGKPVLDATRYADSSFALQIDARSAGDSVLFTWTVRGRRPVSGGLVMHSAADSSVTVVQWYFAFHLRWYPWEKFGSMVFDKQLGPAMEASLERLKQSTGASE